MNSDLKYKIFTFFYILKLKCLTIIKKYKYVKEKRIHSLAIEEIEFTSKNIKNNDILLFTIMRNESLRLPYFIEYYKNLGVDHFFLLDNNSTDDTIRFASEMGDINIFKTKNKYQHHWFWMEYLLEKYGRNHWCLVVDIDELFTYPYANSVSIPQLCQFLEGSNSNAIRSLLLDMYSDKGVKDIDYTAGHDPLKSIPFFDTNYYEVTFPYFDRYRWEIFPSTHFTGGMRERAFGKSIPITSLNKFPLFKFTKGVYLGQGMHAINGAKISNMQGVVFHTKFLGDAISEAEEESIREEHFNNAAYYKDFKREFDQKPDLCLANEQSVRYEKLDQLIELGLMKTSPAFEEYVQQVSGLPV